MMVNNMAYCNSDTGNDNSIRSMDVGDVFDKRS